MDRLWPSGARIDERGELWLGGCAASGLAQSYGTPLYVFDEATLRETARAYNRALARFYPAGAATAYAAKAYLATALAQLLAQEGLDLDVVSGGELHVALQAGYPPGRIHFHGNNKTPQELAQALNAGIGCIVVDNLAELDWLEALLLGHEGHPVRLWLRLAPGIEAHTHAHIQTGQADTKFGLSIATGDAARAVARIARSPHLLLAGLHAHIGSQIFETAPLAAAAARRVAFAAEMAGRHGLFLQELSPGGGWAVPMTAADPDAPIDTYVEAVASAVVSACRAHNLPLPRLVLEPGRSLVARAGVALYRVGSRKEIAGVRTYVAVDGGMADNIRPALYGASYTAALVGDATGRDLETVTIAGRYCESGDILVRDINLPRLGIGDLLAVPMAGAYTLAMASNYNLAPRPAAVLVNKGRTRLLQRRESYLDLAQRDVPLDWPAVASGRLRFAKYQALGNDYIVLDPIDFPDPPEPSFVKRLCDRHLGIGADGLIWGPSADREPFALRLYNPDGSEPGKSGNGLRIFARYLWDRALPARPDFAIQAAGGQVTAHILNEDAGAIALDMGQLSFRSPAIPAGGLEREVVDETIEVGGRPFVITAAGMGNPHCVVFLDDISPELARALGPEIERLPLFPERTNVQFAHVIDRHALRIEIWERGAGYTLASGTSSCAAAGAAIRTGRCASPVTVRMPGGQMAVEVTPDWFVRLTGAVAPVCTGELSRSLIPPAAGSPAPRSAL